MIPVYEDGEIIGYLKDSNNKLDIWDGNNWCRGTGKHMGYSKLKKSGKYVLIHMSQWIGDRDIAEVVSPESLIMEAVKADALDTLIEDYPELKELSEKILDSD